MKSLFLITVFFSVLLSQVRAADDKGGLDVLRATAIKYVVYESSGDWDQCYSMLSSLITHRLALKSFRSSMISFPVDKTFTKPVPANASRLRRRDVELGRVVVRDSNAPANDLTRVASLTLIKENDVWRVISASGLKSQSIIDDAFFCDMIAREIQTVKAEP